MKYTSPAIVAPPDSERRPTMVRCPPPTRPHRADRREGIRFSRMIRLDATFMKWNAVYGGSPLGYWQGGVARLWEAFLEIHIPRNWSAQTHPTPQATADHFLWVCRPIKHRFARNRCPVQRRPTAHHDTLSTAYPAASCRPTRRRSFPCVNRLDAPFTTWNAVHGGPPLGYWQGDVARL